MIGLSACSRTSIAITVLAAGLMSGPDGALAGGFYSPFQSATAIGAAFAGATARNDDASFFYYNPSAIASFTDRQSFVDVRAFAPSVEIDPTDAVSPLGVSVIGEGSSGNIARNALALGSVTVVPIAPGLNLGIGSSAPFATDVETRAEWAGSYHLLKSYMVGMNATGAITWQAAPWIALAAGVQVEWMKNEFRNLAVIPRGLAPPAEALAHLEGESWAAGAVAGLTFTPAAGTRIGLSWRSALTHEIEGSAGAQLPGVPVEHLRYDVDLPQVASLGFEQRLGDGVRVFAEAEWVDWSRFAGFDISFESGRPNELRPIAWQDTWLVGAGLGVRLAPATEVTAGLSYDTGASPDGSGSTLSPDSDKLILGLGLLHDWEGVGRISLSYGYVYLYEGPVKAESMSSGHLDGTLGGDMHMFGLGFTQKW